MNESTISCDVLMDQDNFNKRDIRVDHGCKIMVFLSQQQSLVEVY